MNGFRLWTGWLWPQHFRVISFNRDRIRYLYQHLEAGSFTKIASDDETVQKRQRLATNNSSVIMRKAGKKFALKRSSQSGGSDCYQKFKIQHTAINS
jgi:hypothetical protein